MAGLEDALVALAQSFHITTSSFDAAAPQTFTARLVSSSLGRDGSLQISDLETTTQLVESALDLSFLTKSVRFSAPDITNFNVIGGMPIADLLSLNIANALNGPTSPPGVPGLLGALTGTIQIPMDVTQSTLLDVAIDVRWTITDANGNAIADAGLTWSLLDSSSTVTATGTSGTVPVPTGLALDTLQMNFAPLFVEPLTFSNGVFGVATENATIRAEIQLRAGPASSGWIDLPPVNVPLPVLAIPTILLLFENASFTNTGVGLVMVPANSPLDKSTIQSALQAISQTLAPVQSALSILTFLLSELPGTVTNALQAASNAQLSFAKSDGISDLSTIEWKHHWYGDEDAEDNISSLILIAPPGRQAQCFNGRGFSGSAEGQMNVTLGAELIAEIANLHSAFPASVPSGDVSVPYPPTGWRFAHSISIFGDEFSSIRFA